MLPRNRTFFPKTEEGRAGAGEGAGPRSREIYKKWAEVPTCPSFFTWRWPSEGKIRAVLMEVYGSLLEPHVGWSHSTCFSLQTLLIPCSFHSAHLRSSRLLARPRSSRIELLSHSPFQKCYPSPTAYGGPVRSLEGAITNTAEKSVKCQS